MVSSKASYAKMDRANRAKQFMPFDALSGFREALREKEKLKMEKRELSEEEFMKLEHILERAKTNDNITVEFYKDEEYVRVKGIVKSIDMVHRVLKLDEADIPIEDISCIELD